MHEIIIIFMYVRDGQSIVKEPSDILLDDELKIVQPGSTTEADKSNVVLRRYDKLNEAETSQLLVSGLYVLKTMGRDGLRVFWSKSSGQERAALLQMIHLACSHFTTARKNSTITRKKVCHVIGFKNILFFLMLRHRKLVIQFKTRKQDAKPHPCWFCFL